MVTTRVIASADATRAKAAQISGAVAVGLYQIGRSPIPGVGHGLPHTVAGLPQPPSVRAWDFLSIALAVFGADRFVLRNNTDDGWTRVIALDVEVVEPAPWNAVAQDLAQTLRFLTGDIWQLSFRPGGRVAPKFHPLLSDRTCVTLFSGGMDSLIGTLDLLANNERPLLISQASRIEGQVQAYLAERLGLTDHRFDGRVTALGLDQPERGGEKYELSARARSILFLAYGAVAASNLGGELIVPENGLISINPPLTRRRFGSLSTRTTHPNFISGLQSIFDAVGLTVRLRNPYGFKTKGEMLAECADPRIQALASSSWSCGKGNRKNQQCGLCVPCLIRRASFMKAGTQDATPYRTMDLVAGAKNDDVFAARFAAAQLTNRDIGRWASESGPLPHDPNIRAAYVDVVRRGLGELKELLDTVAWP
mgnify:CR=1 FL=1